MWHCCDHKYLFHWTLIMFSCSSNRYSCNFSNSCSWLINTYIGFTFHGLPLRDSITYFVNINEYKTYTSWYGVYNVATLYTHLLEKTLKFWTLLFIAYKLKKFWRLIQHGRNLGLVTLGKVTNVFGMGYWPLHWLTFKLLKWFCNLLIVILSKVNGIKKGCDFFLLFESLFLWCLHKYDM
jgi:hypothetical protein